MVALLREGALRFRVVAVRENSTQIPSPRNDLGEFPTDPSRPTGKDQNAELKKNQTLRRYPPKTSIIFLIPLPTATRETRNHRSGNAATGDQQRDRTRRADRGGDLDAREEVTRDRNTENHHRPVLLRTTQRPRSANNKATTTARHRELRDPLPDSPDDRYRGMACSLIERH